MGFDSSNHGGAGFDAAARPVASAGAHDEPPSESSAKLGMPRCNDSPLKVLVVGAGPAGLLLAHYLLHYGNGRFRVLLFEKGEDPRQTVLKPPSSRRFSIGLNPRSHGCLSAIPGLAEKVMAQCVQTDTMCLLFGSSTTPTRLRSDFDKESGKGGVIDRAKLCATLLAALLESKAISHTPPPATTAAATGGQIDAVRKVHAAALDGRPESIFSSDADLEVHFHTSCVDVDLQQQIATFELLSSKEHGREHGTKIEETYDLLVGADGLRSAVRFAFQQQERNFEVEQRDLLAQWVVEHFPCPPGYTKGTFHLVPRVPRTPGIAIYGLPSPEGTMCFLWGWGKISTPTEWLACKTAEEAHEYIHSRVPHFNIPKEAAWKLRQQPIQESMRVKCWRYHDSKGHAVLIGDAAHATPPSIGQGCNASLTDASVLARLLLGEKVTEDTRVPEGELLVPKKLAAAAALKASAVASASPDEGGMKAPLMNGRGREEEGEEGDGALDASVVRSHLPLLLARFSALQVKEGHALVDLSESNMSARPWRQFWMSIGFICRQLLSSLFPRLVLPPVMVLASTTTMPYSRIYDQFKRDVLSVLADNNEVRCAWYLKQAEEVEKETRAI